MPNLGILLKLLPIVGLTFGSDHCGDGELSGVDDEQIALNLTGIGFKNISDGFVDDESLTELILDRNQISVVSSETFSFAPKLTYLSLANNLLAPLDLKPFSKLSNLKTLILNGNCNWDSYTPDRFDRRTYIHGRSPLNDDDRHFCNLRIDTVLPSLTHLYVENNTLHQIFVVGSGKLPSLTHLHLSYNSGMIYSPDGLDIKRLAPALTHLYLRHCNSSQFVLFLPPTFKSLYVDENDIRLIESLKLHGAPQLETLSISRNKLERLSQYSFENLVNLVTLDLSHNHISSIRDNTFDKLISLTNLNLGNNQIAHIDIHAFKNTTNLVTLDLSHNRIHRIEYETLENLQLLEHINLEDNLLERSLFDDSRVIGQLVTLRSLFLGKNRIRHIEEGDFQNMIQLSTLMLNDNEISSIDRETFSWLTQLEELSLAGNRLTRIPQRGMLTSSSLVTLNLNSNRFTDVYDIPLLDSANLVSLFLENIRLRSISVKWLFDAPENLTIFLEENVSIVIISSSRRREDRFKLYGPR